MFDHMRHLRFVHNAQTILCLAVVYLIASSWTWGTEVLRDLDGFSQTMQRARRVVEEPDEITRLVPSVRDTRDGKNRRLSETLGRRVTLIAPRVVETTTSLPVDSESIGRQWTALEAQRWRVKEIDITHKGFSDVRDWYAQWYKRWGICVFHFENDRRTDRDHFNPRSPIRGRRFATPDFRVTVADWGTNRSVVSAMVDFVVYVPESRRHPSCRRRHSPRDYMIRDEWTLSPEVKRFGPYQLVVETKMIQLPQSTLDQYNYLRAALSLIGDLAPNEVREWAMREKVSEIRERESRLFGTHIRGEDLGFVAPGAIFALHLYILVTLFSLRSQDGPTLTIEGPLPWFAAMRTTLPSGFTFVTLALCPAVAFGFAVWRWTMLGTGVSVGLFCALLVMGIAIMCLARRLGERSAQNVGAGPGGRPESSVAATPPASTD